MVTPDNQSTKDQGPVDRASRKLVLAVERLEVAVGGLPATIESRIRDSAPASQIDDLRRRNETLQSTNEAVGARLDAAIQRLSRLIG